MDNLDPIPFFEAIDRLQADQKPLFGSMQAQHMVEHLVLTLRFSNGKQPQQRHYSPEKEQRMRAFVLHTDQALPVGFKSPVLPAEGLPPLVYPDLAAAVKAFKTELQDFEAYFRQYPDEKPVNPTMGELDYEEWVRFHSKHVAHHFKQFELL